MKIKEASVWLGGWIWSRSSKYCQGVFGSMPFMAPYTSLDTGLPAALEWNSRCPKISVIGGLRVQEKYTNATLDSRDSLCLSSSAYQPQSVYFGTTQILTVGKPDSRLIDWSRKGEMLTRHLHDNRHWNAGKQGNKPSGFQWVLCINSEDISGNRDCGDPQGCPTQITGKKTKTRQLRLI